MVWPLQRWETRVIHLNLASKPGGKTPQKEGADAPPEPQKPIFSETYLKQEFPDHYSPSGQPKDSAPPQKPQHPATQLQVHMNKLGQDGWEFVGVFPVGQLVMMFFRRPVLDAPAASPAKVAAPPLPEPPSPASNGSTDPAAIQPLLQQILERLERLESRSAAAAAPLLQHSAPSSTGDVLVLSESQCGALPSQQVMPTAKAATVLGRKSPASVLNFGARHGYRIGLVKQSSNGQAAIYMGTQTREGGGKAVRLWSIIPSAELPGS